MKNVSTLIIKKIFSFNDDDISRLIDDNNDDE